MPSSTTTAGAVAVAWKKTQLAPVSSVAVSWMVSAPTLGLPAAPSKAPDAQTELAQPRPRPPLLPRGQGIVDPSPAQNEVIEHVRRDTRKPSTPASTMLCVPPSFAVKRTRAFDVPT